MWELFIVVFIKQEHYSSVSNIQVQSKSTGAIGGYVGNKGGVLIKFELYSHKWMFLNLHLKSGAFN